MSMQARTLPILAGLALVAGFVGARDYAVPKHEPVKLGGNVWLLKGGRGGNIAVSAGPDGVLLIDDQFADLAPDIEAAIESLDRGELKFLVNTHLHGDHTGSNVVFGKNATIIAHDSVRKRMQAGYEVNGRTVSGSPPEALPIVTYDDGIRIHFNGETINLAHYAGGAHTDGDSIVWFSQSRVVHMGDTFFNGRFPFIDLGNGGSVAGLLSTLKAVLDGLPDDAKVIPGHGAVGTKGDLRAYHETLVRSVALIRKNVSEAGRDGALSRGLPAEYAEWGSGFISTDAWIETVYRSYTASR